VAQEAARLNIAAVLGTARRVEAGWHNSLLIIDKGGRTCGYYDKLHRAEPWSVPGWKQAFLKHQRNPSEVAQDEAPIAGMSRGVPSAPPRTKPVP
jgi:predicted amidohydrolase